MAIKPEVIFLFLLCLIGVLWRIIGFWKRKAGEAAYAGRTNGRQRQGVRPLLPSGCHGRTSECLPYVLFLTSRAVRGPSSTQAVQVARHTDDFLRTLLPVPVPQAAQRGTTGFLPFTLPVQEWRSSRHRVLQGVHGRPADGWKALPYHVHAVQQLDKIRAAVQTARLVYRQAPSGTDIGAV